MIVAYIDAHKQRFGIEPICRVLTSHGTPIAPSTYHAAKTTPVSPRDLADAYATNALVDIFRGNRRVYGVRKLWHALRRAGHDVGRDQTARLMRIAGITGVVRGRHTTTTTTRDKHAAARHPDLCDRAWDTPTAPDQWWVADFTYVWTLAGFCYVALLTDVFSRRILGWRVSTSKATPLVLSVLEQALFVRRRGDARFTATGLVHHSDAGSQPGTRRWRSPTRSETPASPGPSAASATRSTTRSWNPRSACTRPELIDQHPKTWTGWAEVERETAAWVHWYNTTRLHSALGYRPPIEYEHDHPEEAIATTIRTVEVA